MQHAWKVVREPFGPVIAGYCCSNPKCCPSPRRLVRVDGSLTASVVVAFADVLGTRRGLSIGRVMGLVVRRFRRCSIGRAFRSQRRGIRLNNLLVVAVP